MWTRFVSLALPLTFAFACGQTRTPSEPNSSAAGSTSSSAGSGGETFGGAGRISSGGSAGDQQNTGNAEVLYDLSPRRPFPIEVDNTHLYWAEIGEHPRVVRAPKTGTGPLEELGPWSGVEVSKQVIVVDSTHVYWLDDAVIRKVSKSDGIATTIELGKPQFEGGWCMIGDADNLYFADRDAVTIGRVSKAGGSPSYFTTAARPNSNGTKLAIDADSVLVGNAHDLFVFDKKGGTHVALATVADEDYVGPIVSSGASVYWANNRVNLSSRTANLAMIPKAGGTITNLGTVGINSAILRLDTPRNHLYWTTRSGSKFDRVLSYSISERKLTVMAEGYEIFGGMAHDGEYVYWAGRFTILRLAK